MATKPRKALVQKHRVIHMYSELWHASGCVLAAGLREPRGSSWQFLSSTVLTAFAFEAYMNHVGPCIFDCWAELERLSPWSKFELLCEELQVKIPGGVGKPPLQTIKILFEFRNTMAHGRSEEVTPSPELRDVNDKLDRYLGKKPLTDWERLIQSPDFAKRARRDVQKVLEKVHAARPDPKEPLFTSGIGSHSATLVSES